MNQKRSAAVTIRALKKEDYPQVEQIISDTWHYQMLSPDPKDAAHMARLYLRSGLVRHTFARVAVKNGRILGILLGRHHLSAPRFRIRAKLSMLYSACLLLSSKQGRKIARLFSGFDAADKQLLENTHTDFDGELVLFALAGPARGHGIGKALLAEFLAYMKKEQAKQFFLFTDTTCTYEFYEHNGFQRIGALQKQLPILPDKKIEMYIYQYQIDAL